MALFSQLKSANEELRIEAEELERSKEELGVSERKYRLLFDNMTAGFALNEMVYDEQGEPVDYRFLEVNPAFEQLTGVQAEAIVGKTVMEALPGTEKYWIDTFAKVAQTGKPVSYENFSQEIGKYFDTWVFSPEPDKFAVVFTDITQRRQLDQKLRKLSSAVEHSSASVVITDKRGAIEYVNPAFTKTTGFSLEEALGNNPRILKSGRESPEVYKELWKTILSGETWTGELHNRRKDCSEYWERASISPVFDESGEITHFVAVKEDITERKRMNKKLRETQKVESLGIMAGGIAHMFNNLLSVVIGYGELFKDDPDLDAQQRKNAEEMVGAAIRAADLSGKMLSYTGQKIIDKTSLDLSSVAGETAGSLGQSLAKGVALEVELAPDLPPVKGDAGELVKVIEALLSNAAEALGEDGGKIGVATGVTRLEADQIKGIEAVGEELGAGDYVYLDITDTGCGIDGETLPRIFDPFFTTKFEGRGLGLPVALGIVKVHGGAILVESNPALGTGVRVLIPVG